MRELTEPCVMRLEWVNDQSGFGPVSYHAKTPFGWFMAYEDQDSAAGWVLLEWALALSFQGTDKSMRLGKFAEFPDAKEHAQSQFEAKVMSCLREVPAPEERPMKGFFADMTNEQREAFHGMMRRRMGGE
ncbi:hypothetical protein [Aureimonas sp. AU20]|uniref:hypothetical protein n=1 Tax=Aureimonas sp. AU20 TaxID=1349819 RepID=UPI00071F70B6|nr:hypothetical protein [Aureimonas sp. AU20]ALN73511.1 hypothetical protein M673_12375 [Aureimonas sp. AU20]